MRMRESIDPNTKRLELLAVAPQTIAFGTLLIMATMSFVFQSKILNSFLPAPPAISIDSSAVNIQVYKNGAGFLGAFFDFFFYLVTAVDALLALLSVY